MSRATKKICLLSLAAVSLLLTSCNNSEIYPDLSNEVTVNDNTLLTRDDLVYIYEKLHDSSTTGSEVRDLILARYAVNLIGDFTLFSVFFNLCHNYAPLIILSCIIIIMYC